MYPKFALFDVQQLAFGFANCGVLVNMDGFQPKLEGHPLVEMDGLGNGGIHVKNPGPIRELRPTLPTCWAAPPT